jgi:gluconolactonase
MLERLFTLPEGTHEAPNFLPKQNKVFVSNFNYTYEYLIDLNSEPPVLQNLITTPELQSVNGGFLYQGKLIVGTDGYRNSTPPGLYIYDPATNTSEVLLNNFRGLKFNTPDDLVVDHLGQVWFVDAP